MQFRGFRIHVALIVFLVVFGLGLGVRYLHQQRQVLEPLIEQIQSVPGVADVHVEQAALSRGALGRGARIALTLELQADAPLAIVFPRVHQALLSQGGNFGMRVEDAPDALLLELFQRIQIALEEAVVTGEFTALENRVEYLADEADVDWDLGLDREFIYLSLARGESTLLRIINRGASEGPIRIYTDGGVTSWPNG